MTNRIFGDMKSVRDSDCESSTAQKMSELKQGAAEKVKQMGENIEHLVTSHPTVSMLVAVAAGVTLGWWVKRK